MFKSNGGRTARVGDVQLFSHFRLEPAQQPPETGLVHRLRLGIGKQFRLDESAEPPVDSRRLDLAHQFNHAPVDVQFVVVEHHACDAVVLMEGHEFSDDIVGGPTPNSSKH